jgi:hypothetical protein
MSSAFPMLHYNPMACYRSRPRPSAHPAKPACGASARDACGRRNPNLNLPLRGQAQPACNLIMTSRTKILSWGNSRGSCCNCESEERRAKSAPESSATWRYPSVGSERSRFCKLRPRRSTTDASITVVAHPNQIASSAWRKSRRRSSKSSTPTERRTSESPMPKAPRCAAGIEPCVISAGCSIRLSTPPRLSASANR